MSDVDVLVFFEGRFVPMQEARVPILTHALHYGTGVFEGIRGYWSEGDQELYMVRLEDHYQRWRRNARMLGMEIRQSAFELAEITCELARRNGFRTDIYVRPLAYFSSPRIGVLPDGKFQLAIVAIPFGVYLPSEQGIHAGVASWRRVEDTAIPLRAKISGSYVNSVLATTEAHQHGYDEAIFLSEDGHVCEGATCNLFLVRNGALVTPAASDNILEGITRQSIIDLARRELRLDVVERPVDRSELYVCDEAFLTGTAVEVAPITRIDHRPVGEGRVGPVSGRLRQLYRDATHGRLSAYHHWLHAVYQPAVTPLSH